MFTGWMRYFAHGTVDGMLIGFGASILGFGIGTESLRLIAAGSIILGIGKAFFFIDLFRGNLDDRDRKESDQPRD